MNKIIKKLLTQINDSDHRNDFQPKWYAILFKPLFITRRWRFKRIIAFSRKYNFENKKILDVGCGTKPYENIFKNCQYVGIDIKGASHDDNLKNVDKFYDGENIPFDDREFDLVICTEVLEHSENPKILTKEINRVLKEGGLLFITIPFVWNEHAIPFDFRRYTTFGLKKLLKESDLKVEMIEPTSGIFGTVGQLISCFLFDTCFNTVKIRSYYKRFVVQKLFSLVICFPIQAISLILDHISGNKGIALGYAIIAKKHEL